MVLISFIGDVMLGRLIHDKHPVGEYVVQHLKDSSLNIINLECVITKKFVSRSQLKENAKANMCKHGANTKQAILLNALNVNMCNLANNHILDYDFDGVKNTIQFLNENNIKWFGFGKNYDTAWKPRIMKLKSPSDHGVDVVKVALFGLADHFVEWKANEDSPGINYFDISNFLNGGGNVNRAQWQDFQFITDQIDKVRKSVDLIIFSIHWGENFQVHVSDVFQQFAHALIDHGVDIIHGHSSHHFQGIEIYKEKLILYGCGDFINDYKLYEDLLQTVNETLGDDYIRFRSDLGFVYKLNLQRSLQNTICLEKLTMIPISICNGKVEISREEDRIESFNRMFKACKQFRTNLLVEDDVMVIEIT